MKKYICVLLAQMLVMSSCTQPQTDDSDNKSVFYIDGVLPDIGEFSGGKKHEHFYDTYTPDFIPSDNYGEIIPYIGGYKIYKSNDTEWNAEQGYASYGFCTPDGKIVMDASEKNSHINYFETYDGFCYYTVLRNIAQKPDAPDEYYASETLLIPESGKWCKVLDNNSWVSSVGSGMICVDMYVGDNDVKTVVYDYDGNELFSVDGLMTLGVPSKDLILFCRWSDGVTEYFFLNKKGERVLDSYKYAAAFNSKGVTHVCDYNDDYYFIDINGNRLTHESYSGVNEYICNDGSLYYIARHKYYPYRGSDILDSDGKIIASIQDSSYITLRFPKNGEILYRGNDGKWKNLSDGSLLKSKEYDVSPSEFYGTDDIYIYKNENDGSGILFDADGETVAAFDSFCDFIEASGDGRFITYNSGSYDYRYDEVLGKGITTDTRRLHIYDTDKKENVYTFDVSGYANFVGSNDRYICITTYESDYFAGSTLMYLYDTKTGKIIFDECQTIRYTSIGGKDYFNVCTDKTFTLYDGDMNVILRNYSE